MRTVKQTPEAAQKRRDAMVRYYARQDGLVARKLRGRNAGMWTFYEPESKAYVHLDGASWAPVYMTAQDAERLLGIVENHG